MAGFLSKIFGGGKKDSSGNAAAEGTVSFVEATMAGLLERACLELDYTVTTDTTGETEEINVEMSGADEDLLTEKEGALLDAFQLLFKRALQHQLPDNRVNISFDCNGYRDESSKALIDLADKLKEKALDSGRSVYLRALPPKDRKIVHQHLANDERVRSRSVGEGLFKKVKIYPVKENAQGQNSDEIDTESESENFGNR